MVPSQSNLSGRSNSVVFCSCCQLMFVASHLFAGFGTRLEIHNSYSDDDTLCCSGKQDSIKCESESNTCVIDTLNYKEDERKLRHKSFIGLYFDFVVKTPVSTDDSVQIYLYMDWNSKLTCMFEVFKTNFSATKLEHSGGFELNETIFPGFFGPKQIPVVMPNPLVALSLVQRKKFEHQVRSRVQRQFGFDGNFSL